MTSGWTLEQQVLLAQYLCCSGGEKYIFIMRWFN